MDEQDKKIQFLQEQIDNLKGTSASPSIIINPQQISDTIKNIDDVLNKTEDIEIEIDGNSEYYDRFGNLKGSSKSEKKPDCEPVDCEPVDCKPTNCITNISSILDMSNEEIEKFIQNFIEKIKDPGVSKKVIEIFQILNKNIDELKGSKDYDILARIIKTILEKILGDNEFDGNDFGDEESDYRNLGIDPTNPNSTKEFVENLTNYLQESLNISKSFPDKLAEKLEEVFFKGVNQQ